MSQLQITDTPTPEFEIADTLATPVDGIPQSTANPLFDVFGRPDYRDDHEKAMDTWRQESFTALDAAVIDPTSYGDERVPSGYTPDEWRKTRVVDDWMRLHSDGEEPPMGLSREFTRARLAERVFGGAGAENDDALFGEITKAASGRKNERDFQTKLMAAVADDVAMPLGKGKGMSAFLNAAKGRAGYDAGKAADYAEAWAESRSQMAEKMAPYREQLDAVWSARRTGGEVTPETLASIPDEDLPGFLKALRLRAETLGDEEKETFLAGMRKDFARTWESAAGRSMETITEAGFEMLKDGKALDEKQRYGFERGEWQAAKEGSETARNRAHEVRRIMSSTFDPIDYVDGWGWAQKIPGVTTTSLSYAVPGVGTAFMVSSIEGMAQEKAYLNARSKGVSETAAGEYSSAMGAAVMIPQVVLEKIGIGIWTNKIPALTGMLRKMDDAILNRGLRFAAKTGTIGALETGVELTQDVAEMAVTDIAHAMNSDLPDVDWNTELKGAWNSIPEIFGSMVLLSMFGAAGGLNAEARQAAFARSSTTEMEAFGINPEGIAAIQGAQGPASLAAAIDSAMETRDPNSETAQAAVGTLKLQLETQRRAQQNLENLGYAAPSFVQSTEGITVFDGEGRELGTAPDLSGAVRIARAHTVALDDMQADQVAALGSLMEAAKAAVALDPQSTLDVNLGAFDPDTASPEMAARFAAQVALKEQAEGGTGDIARSVLGYSVTEMAQGVRQTVNRIFRGAAVTDVFHETFHGLRRQARAAGTITRPDELAMLRALDTVLADKMTRDGVQLRFIPENMTDDQVSETLLDEAFSEIAEMEILRTRKGAGKGKLGLTRGVISRNITALTKLIPGVAGKWTAFMQAVRARWGLSLSRAVAMKKAERDGTFDKQGYDAYLDKVLGLDQQTEHDAGVKSELDSILGLPDEIADDDIPFSIGRSFENWFRKSAVVDTDGKPLKVFHGGARFDAFSSNPAAGAHFAIEDEDAAQTYADQSSDGEVKPLYLSIQNPLIIDGEMPRSGDPAIRKAREDGHDGIIAWDTDAANHGKYRAFAFFEPVQAKAAGSESGSIWGTPIVTEANNGEYSNTDERLAFSIGRASVTPTAETRTFQGAAGSPSVIGPAAFSIGAFHGTPHQVDKFSTAKIGTGEGAQAYGWGLYFAAAEAVGRGYMKAGRSLGIIKDSDGKWWTTDGSQTIAGPFGSSSQAQQIADAPAGNLYRVTLKVEDEDLLDWDQPLSEQGETIQNIARTADISAAKGATKGALLAWREGRDVGMVPTGQTLHRAIADYGQNTQAASELLAAAGIRGIRYLDGNSRADGEGSYNYVVFDEADIEILEENGTPVDLSAPAFSLGRTDRPLFSATNVQDLRHDKTAWLDGDASPAGANDIVSKYYKTAAFAGIPKDALLVAMPSTSGRNILPFALANRISKDFGQAIEQRPVGTATAKAEAKNKRTFFDKEADPVAFVPNAEVIADLQGKRVFITEDVHNTGESWIAFARMLMDHGVQVLGVATLVSTEQRITSPRDIERLSEKIAAATGKGIDEVLPAMHSLFDGTFKQLFNKAEAEVSRSNTRRNARRNAENSAKLFDIASSGRRAGAYSNPLQSGDGSGGEVLGGDGLSQDTFSFSLGGAKAGGFEKAKAEGRAFTGKDGKERFEMDASQAAFNPSAIKDPAHRNGFKRLGADSPIRWLVPDGMDTPLGNILAFDELYENYPQLAGLKVNLHHGDPSTFGSFARVEINGKISLGFSTIYLSDKLTAGQAFSTLLHEVQHAIQQVEGFSPGSSPEAETKEYNRLRARYNGIHSSDEMREYERKTEEVFQKYDRDEITAEEMYATIQALGKSDPAYKELLQVTEELQSMSHGMGEFNAHRAYRNRPGEKEARGVQARQSMTAEQRAASPFMDQWGSFSIGPAKVADIMAGNALKRITDPRRRTQVMSRIARDFGNMRLQIERMASLSGIRRSKGDLRREAMAREDLRAEELIADVHRRFGEIMADEDLVKIKSQPVHAALADPESPLRGRLKSKAAAIKDRPDMFQLHRAGDYDGSDGVSRSVFGGQRMPDQAAQELYEDGLIQEPTADALWEALLSEQKTVAGMKELLEKAKEQIRAAKAQAKQEANEWLATQGKDQEVNFSDKEEIRRSLRMLDAILLALPPEIRGKIGGYTQISMIGTDEARLAYLKDKLAKADKELETFLRVEYAAEWEDLLRKAAPATNEAGQRPTGSIAADAYDIFRVAEAAMGMSFAEGEAEADKWDAIADHPDTDIKDVDMARVKAQMTRLTMNWHSADAARREQAVLEGEKIYYNGLLALKVEASRRRERLGKLRDSAVRGTGKTGHRMEREAAKQETSTKLGAVKAMAWEFLSFGQVVNVLFGEKSAAAQWFNSREISASNAAHDGFQAKANALESLFDTLSGNRFDGEKLRHRMATDPRIKVQDVLGVDHTFTESQAITFLLMYRQEDGKRHLQGLMDEDGNILSEWAWDDQSAATLEAGLSPEGRAAMAFLGSSYGEEYGRINDVFRRIWNVSMPRHKMYAPLSVKPVQGKGDTIMDPVSGDTMGAGMTPGSLKNRSFSAIAEPDFKDAFQVYLTHARQMEHFIAYGEFARDSLAIINRRETRNAIEAAGGADAAGTLSKWIDYFALGGVHGAAMGGRWATILGGMLGRLSQAALVGRVSVLFMQSLQLAAASFKMPTGAFITRFAKLSAGRLQWGDTIQSEYVQRRLQQLPPVVRDMMAGMASGTPNRAKYLAAAAGRSIAGADALFTAGTYAIFYDYHLGLAKKAAIANPQAHAHAEAERLTDQVAQPVRTGARSWLEVANASNPAFRAAWNFSSDPRQKMSLLVYAAMRKDTTGTEKAADVAFTAAKLWIIGGVLSTLVRTVLRDLRNDDDDEIFDERYWSPTRLALQVATGPIGGAPFLGDMVEGATYKATGQFMPSGGMLSFFDQAAALPKKWAGGKVEPIKDLETLTSAGAGFSGTSAAAASAMHLIRDVVGFIENLEGPD